MKYRDFEGDILEYTIVKTFDFLEWVNNQSLLLDYKTGQFIKEEDIPTVERCLIFNQSIYDDSEDTEKEKYLKECRYYTRADYITFLEIKAEMTDYNEVYEYYSKDFTVGFNSYTIFGSFKY